MGGGKEGKKGKPAPRPHHPPPAVVVEPHRYHAPGPAPRPYQPAPAAVVAPQSVYKGKGKGKDDWKGRTVIVSRAQPVPVAATSSPSAATAASSPAKAPTMAASAPGTAPSAPPREHEGQVLQIVIPDGVRPGDRLNVEVSDGDQRSFVVPEGVAPGAQIQFWYDGSSLTLMPEPEHHNAVTKPPMAKELGGALLRPVHQEHILGALQACLHTNPEWLGKGRDASASEEYSKLTLTAAWEVSNRIQESRYGIAKQALESEIKQTPRGCTSFRMMTHDKAYALGVSLSQTLNEGLALHGTKADALSPILSSGLNERFATGTFGDGIYLAEDAGKADQYAQPERARNDSLLHRALYPASAEEHPGDVCYMLVCQVLLGEPAFTFDGHRKIDGGNLWADAAKRRELVSIPGTEPPFAYHSLVVETGAAVKRYREFVSFHSDRVLVKYLIAYRRSGGGSGGGDAGVRSGGGGGGSSPAARDGWSGGGWSSGEWSGGHGWSGKGKWSGHHWGR